MKTIEELEKEEKELKERLFQNRSNQRNFYMQEAFLKHNISLGDKVSFKDGIKDVIGIIDLPKHSQVNHKVHYFTANLLRKNGTPGRNVTIYRTDTIRKIND